MIIWNIIGKKIAPNPKTSWINISSDLKRNFTKMEIVGNDFKVRKLLVRHKPKSIFAWYSYWLVKMFPWREHKRKLFELRGYASTFTAKSNIHEKIQMVRIWRRLIWLLNWMEPLVWLSINGWRYNVILTWYSYAWEKAMPGNGQNLNKKNKVSFFNNNYITAW